MCDNVGVAVSSLHWLLAQHHPIQPLYWGKYVWLHTKSCRIGYVPNQDVLQLLAVWPQATVASVALQVT